MRLSKQVPLAAALVVLAGSATIASGQAWSNRNNGNFSDATNWSPQVVPVSDPATQLTFTNPGIASYRAFNDLGVLTLGGISLESRTNTATFIGIPPASSNAFRFVNDAEVVAGGSGLFRFGGGTGAAPINNAMQLDGTLRYTGDFYAVTWLTGPLSNGTGAGKIVLDYDAPNQTDAQLRLDGTSTFTGGIDLVSGNLVVYTAASVGSGPITAYDGTLRTNSSMTFTNQFNIVGTLNFRPASAFFTISSAISGDGGITLSSLSDSIAQSVTLSGNNIYTGPTTISAPTGTDLRTTGAGRLTVSGAAAGIASSSEYNIFDGGILEITNATGGFNQLSDTAPINLRNGRINALGGTGVGSIPTTEIVGPVEARGNNIFFINGRTGGMTFATPALNRVDRGTLQITRSPANLASVTSTAAPEMVGGIVPWMVGTTGTLITAPRNLVTWDNGVLRTLDDTEYANDLASGGNVKLLAETNNDGIVTVNSLVLGVSGANGTGDFSLSGSGTVNVTSGAVLLATTGGISNNIDFGSAEGIVTSGTITQPFTGTMYGTNGVTFAGEYAFTTDGQLAYTGLTTINAGGIRFTHPDTFPATSGFRSSTGGGELNPNLDYRGEGTAVITQDAFVEGGIFRIAARDNPGNKLVFAGTISGPGAVSLESVSTAANRGTTSLTADNTYTGGTQFVNAIVELESDAVLGDPSGPVVINASAINLAGDWDSARTLRLAGGTTFDVGSHDANLSGMIEGSGSFTVLGDGVVRVTGETVNSGTWTVGGASTGAVGAVEISGQHQMGFSVYSHLTISGIAGRLTTFTPPTGIGGTLDVGGDAPATLHAVRVALSQGTFVNFNLGEESDLIISLLELANPVSGNSNGPVTFNFKVDPSATVGTYTLVRYQDEPSAAQTFVIEEDLAYTADVDGFDGWFEIVTLPDGWFALNFNVTAVGGCLGDIADDFGLIASEGGGPDGVVDFGDFAALLGLIGPCDGGTPGCLGDIADDFGLIASEGGGPDGVVDFGDFAALLGLIGPCP